MRFLFSPRVFLCATLTVAGVCAVGSAQTAPARKTAPAPATQPTATAQAAAAPAQAVARKAPNKDEVFFTIARRINQQQPNSSPSGLVSVLDGVFEIKEIVPSPEGKMIVTVQERAPSNASYTQKSTRLKLGPAAEKDKWTWDEFEEAKRFYPVEKIFPYTQNDLNKKKQAIAAKWANLAMSINKQCDAALKVLETAKAVTKSDMPQQSTWQGLRASLNDALKNNDQDGIIYAYRDIASNSDGIVTLGDNYPDLKANDAFLRLIEEFKGAVNGTAGARRDYSETVKVYNDTLVRLPFALVAAGMEFQRVDAKVEE